MTNKSKTAGKTANKKAATKKVAAKSTDKKVIAAPKEKAEPLRPADTIRKVKTEKDFSTYKWDGQVYGKGPFILAVIKWYLKKHKVDFKKFDEVFPSKLVPRYGVVAPLSLAKAKSEKKASYFLKEEQIVEIGGKKYTVSNQITKSIFDGFLENMKKQGSLETSK